MTRSAASTRSSGSLTLSFGLVSVPVALYSGVCEDAGTIKRHQYSSAGNPIRYSKVDEVTGEVVAASDIIMRYTCANGEKVELTDEEIASAMGEANGQAELLGFYPLAQLGRYTTASTVSVRPQTVKSGKTTTRPFDAPFVLLMAGMEDRGVFALLRYTLRGKPRLGALTADGSMRVLYWEDELRVSLPLPTTVLGGPELALAGQLIDAMTRDEAPVLENDAVAKVREYAEAKVAGVTSDTAPVTELPVAVDLMAALQASLALKEVA